MRHMDTRLREDPEASAKLATDLESTLSAEERELRMGQLTLMLVDRAVQGLSLLVILSRQEYHLPRVIKQLAMSLEQKKPLLLHGLKFWYVLDGLCLSLCFSVVSVSCRHVWLVLDCFSVTKACEESALFVPQAEP